LLNCSVTMAFTGTLAAPLTGLVTTTRAGGVLSVVTPVVKLLWNACVIRMPAASRTPCTVVL